VITDKICYIYLRNQRPDGHYEVKGGATIAWLVDSRDGSIVIGKPSRCMADDPKSELKPKGDVFVKAVGRRNAYNNLTDLAPAFVVKRETLIWLAANQAVHSLQLFDVLSPSAVNGLYEHFLREIKSNVESFMNSNWYEQVVRSHFVLHPDNRLSLAPAAATPENIKMSFQ
jgi:hypothetical protein